MIAKILSSIAHIGIDAIQKQYETVLLNIRCHETDTLIPTNEIVLVKKNNIIVGEGYFFFCKKKKAFALQTNTETQYLFEDTDFYFCKKEKSINIDYDTDN